MTNPLKFDPAREDRIRIRAYHLWEDEGRPEGRAAELWERASELELMEESGNPGQLPNPQAAGADPEAPRGVEDAFIQENLGEFPGQLTDQGDVLPTPNARKSPKADEPAPQAAPPKATKPKAPEPKAPEPKAPEAKAPEPKAPEPKAPEPKKAAPAKAEQKAAPKAAPKPPPKRPK